MLDSLQRPTYTNRYECHGISMNFKPTASTTGVAPLSKRIASVAKELKIQLHQQPESPPFHTLESAFSLSLSLTHSLTFSHSLHFFFLVREGAKKRVAQAFSCFHHQHRCLTAMASLLVVTFHRAMQVFTHSNLSTIESSRVLMSRL